jgi:hypothetical protein
VRGDLAIAIDALRRPERRRGMAVIISDFLGPINWMRPLRRPADDAAHRPGLDRRHRPLRRIPAARRHGGRVMSAERQRRVMSAERQRRVMSAERQRRVMSEDR